MAACDMEFDQRSFAEVQDLKQWALRTCSPKIRRRKVRLRKLISGCYRLLHFAVAFWTA